MTITVENLQKRIPLKPQAILQAAKKILRHEKVATADLSIVFVSDSRIKSLNKKYLKKRQPTDVLSFDFKSVARDSWLARPGFHARRARVARRKDRNERKTIHERRATSHEPQLCGEIIISTDTAVKNAKIYHTRPHQEILLYVVHGILHLSGYDDHAPGDVQKIRRKEAELMNFLKK